MRIAEGATSAMITPIPIWMSGSDTFGNELVDDGGNEDGGYEKQAKREDFQARSPLRIGGLQGALARHLDREVLAVFL